MFYVYIIRSLKTGKYYTGSCSNLLERLKRHNKGYTKSLRNNGPFKLVYKELLPTRAEAYRREMQIKSYKGGNAFKKLIQNNI